MNIMSSLFWINENLRPKWINIKFLHIVMGNQSDTGFKRFHQPLNRMLKLTFDINFSRPIILNTAKVLYKKT